MNKEKQAIYNLLRTKPNEYARTNNTIYLAVDEGLLEIDMSGVKYNFDPQAQLHEE